MAEDDGASGVITAVIVIFVVIFLLKTFYIAVNVVREKEVMVIERYVRAGRRTRRPRFAAALQLVTLAAQGPPPRAHRAHRCAAVRPHC